MSRGMGGWRQGKLNSSGARDLGVDLFPNQANTTMQVHSRHWQASDAFFISLCIKMRDKQINEKTERALSQLHRTMI
jgi:hypothetical protein